MSEIKDQAAPVAAQVEENSAPASVSEAGGLPPAVAEFKAGNGKGFVLNDPFDQNEHFYFRNPTRADLAFYVKVAGLRQKPKGAMERLACDCAIHPGPEELKNRFKEAPALAASFQEEFFKRLGGGRFFTWEEIGVTEGDLPEPVKKALGEDKRVIRVADEFEGPDVFYFRRPSSVDQENFQTTSQIRQKPLVAMERLGRDCAIHPTGKELIKRYNEEPALAMELHEQLNLAMGGGRGFDAQDF